MESSDNDSIALTQPWLGAVMTIVPDGRPRLTGAIPRLAATGKYK